MWQHFPMGTRSIDLFDDPPWPTQVPVDQPISSRPVLVVSLGFVVLEMLSTILLPWFSSPETPGLTPFSHWLDLGWSPGTEKWGYVVLALCTATVFAVGIAIATPGKVRVLLLLLVGSSLVVVTLLEAGAHLSIDPGPNLTADYGAWFGSVAAALAWIGTAVATFLTYGKS